ncbi:MAG: TIGR03663 family protein, partial [Planctomycetes bacterium]|nr:TIGR03663 family protein [Planctomycetota bacterium]
MVFIACIAAVALGAIALRVPRLDVRPMHGDEGNQAVKAGMLLETGVYRYDPRDHHGPSLYYLTLPVLRLASVHTLAEATETLLRLLPVAMGVGVILLLMGAGNALGRPAAVCAGVLTAVSPAMVFFSRYYIQEMLLVFFTFGAIVCAWRSARSRSLAWAVPAGLCVGLMHATKETWVLAAAAMVAGAAGAALWSRWFDRGPAGEAAAPDADAPGRRLRFGLVAGAIALAVGVVASVTFFSSFFTYARGVLESVMAYAYYFDRAGGAGLHDKPWDYYLAMLAFSRFVTGTGSGPWWSEGLILGLAVVGAVAALARRGIAGASPGFLRFLVFYTLTLTGAYAAIPYKTPWCALGFLHGYILLAGVGAVALVRWMPRWPLKVIVGAALVVLAGHLGWQAYRASFVFPADQRNPYVYAHTAPDALSLVRRVEEAASVSPDGRDTVVKVIAPENYWPLPWYLRHFNPDHVGYYHEVPADPDAPIIVTSGDPDFQKALDARLRKSYNRQSTFGIRPGVLMTVYVEDDLWRALVDRWSRPAPGGAE